MGMTLVSAGIGAFGVLSLTNLSAITYLSNFGTFLLYGVTCLIAVYALSRESRSVLTKYVIPIAGFAANVVMLITVIWLGVIGGGAHTTGRIHCDSGSCSMDGYWTCILRSELEKQRIKHLSLPRRK